MTKQRLLFKLLTCTLALAYLLSTQMAWAVPVSYFQTADGAQAGLKTTLPVKQLGPLVVPSGLVAFDGNDIEVQAVPEGLFDPRQVLSGIMVKSRTIMAPGPQAITGLAYFFGGPWLNYLSKTPAFELIERTDGAAITGQIVEGDEKSLSIKQANGQTLAIEFSQIANIVSPRALKFLIPLENSFNTGDSLVQGQTTSVRFSVNNGGQPILASKRPVKPLLGDERGISNASILSYLMLDLFATIAPAIATPLVINNRTDRTASRTAFRANAAAGLP